MSWFEKEPALLKEELDALSASGYQYEIDKVARADGRLTIDVIYIVDDVEHSLRCDYPSSYPYFAVKITSQTFPSGRHKDPYFDGLCLFEDEQSVWDVSNDTLAKVLNEQIPEILKAHACPEVEYENEGKVGYQVSGQIPYENRSVIFVDDFVLPELDQFGEMTLKIHQSCTAETPVIGFIENISCSGKIISGCNISFSNIYTKKLCAKWVRLDKPPESIKEMDVLNEAIKINPKLKYPDYKKKDIDIVGLLFPEEAGYRETVYNWIFIVRRRARTNQRDKNTKGSISIIRSDRYTSDNLNKRVPKLRSLANKVVTIIGVGALGSEVARQLARAGIGGINIVDCDVVQVGNSPRWILGMSAVGINKVDALSMHIAQNYPSVRCMAINMRIGIHQKININNLWIDEREFMEQLISESDMVIDAAAETNVSGYISQLCINMNVVYVWATGTQGAWGGIVGRVIPSVTGGTWMDFSYQYSNGGIHIPPAEEGSDIQPVGCFHQTFTGTGFDMDNISIMASRLAVSTMLRDEKAGYPDIGWDIGVLELWNEDSETPIFPKWYTYSYSDLLNNQE